MCGPGSETEFDMATASPSAVRAVTSHVGDPWETSRELHTAGRVLGTRLK